jgi:hypothetical protein
MHLAKEATGADLVEHNGENILSNGSKGFVSSSLSIQVRHKKCNCPARPPRDLTFWQHISFKVGRVMPLICSDNESGLVSERRTRIAHHHTDYAD